MLGVRINGNSILNFGDLSVLSFHATKVFNTLKEEQLFQLMRRLQHIDDLKTLGLEEKLRLLHLE